MKHSLKIILILVVLFFSAQIIGLLVTDFYLPKDLPYNIERPELEPETSFIHITALILIVTIIIFILAKFKFFRLWKVWFFIAVLFTLSISFATVLSQITAFILAFILGFFK